MCFENSYNVFKLSKQEITIQLNIFIWAETKI
jgi:hypothetical protein